MRGLRTVSPDVARIFHLIWANAPLSAKVHAVWELTTQGSHFFWNRSLCFKDQQDRAAHFSDKFPAARELTVALARQVLDGIENDSGDARLADALVSTLGDYSAKLMPEDQPRFAEQIRVLPEFMDAYQRFDKACADGDAAGVAQQMEEINWLPEKSERAMKFLGLTDAAEALAKVAGFAVFCVALPSVELNRTYGSGFSGTSPFPLMWATGAFSTPLQRVQLMLETGARTGLSTRLGETVLHAMTCLDESTEPLWSS